MTLLSFAIRLLTGFITFRTAPVVYWLLRVECFGPPFFILRPERPPRRSPNDGA